MNDPKPKFFARNVPLKVAVAAFVIGLLIGNGTGCLFGYGVAFGLFSQGVLAVGTRP